MLMNCPEVMKGNRIRGTESKLMQAPNIHSIVGRNSFSYQRPNHWNSIESKSRQIESITIFKSTLTKGMCHDGNYHVEMKLGWIRENFPLYNIG